MTIEGLRERINKIPHEFYNHVQEHFNILQMICSNENVAALEVVEYLLKEYDTNGASRAIDTRYCNDPSIAYPLHFACKSKSCPNFVQLLAERYPAALSHVSVIVGGVHIEHQRRDPRMDDHDICGLPLQYYLSREENIDIDTVKRMVELYPNALLGSENAWFNSILYAPLDVLLMNPSIDNSFEIAQYLIETNAESIRRSGGDSSLQIACSSCRVDPRVIGLIIEARPELLRHQDGGRNTPIHNLIVNRSYSENGMSISESVATEIAALMVKKEPALLRIVNQSGALPLHLAARKRSPQFCKILVDGYKESTKVSVNGHLPVHLAAYGNHLDTVKYLFDTDPSTLNTHDHDGKLFFRTVQMEGGNPDVKAFLEVQWTYYFKANMKHTSTLTQRDSDGQVPLHHALCDNHATLGSIKLLLEASPDSLFIADNDGIMPLHMACGFSSAEIVEYLVNYFAASFGEERRPNIMLKKDKWGNTPLHYACHYDKCDVVKVLLGKQKHTVTVSERNDDGKLPIQLLCDPPRIGFDKRIDREGVEYTEALWLLLRNCPETIVNW